MLKYIKIITAMSVVVMLLGGCSSTNKNLQLMEETKKLKNKNKINISSQVGYKTYLDSNNNLKYICMSGDRKKCNYYSSGKHSYYSQAPDEEHLFLSTDGYNPPLSENAKDVQCGKGSLWGWLAITGMKPMAIENYSKRSPITCNSKFTEVDSTQIFHRLGYGLFTFMTPLITGGSMHTRKFLRQEFIDSIYISNIDSFKTQLFNLTTKYKLDGGIDVIYLKRDDVSDNLEDKYNELLKDKSLKAGLILIEKDTNKLLAINIFNKYKKKNILSAISLQIEDILKSIAQNNTYDLDYEDILAYIPNEIPFPSIPKVRKIIKNEFETKDEFNKRVLKLVEDREERIRNLQRKYSLDVFERNTYISDLQESYKQYLKYKNEEQTKLLSEIKLNIPLLSKILFLENTSGYSANNFKYNAEKSKLYFTIYSKQKKFKQKVVAIIPADDAKRIKFKKSFTIIPKISSNKNRLTLTGFQILEKITDNSYDVSYTNINFRPETISLRVTGNKESMKKEVSNYFKKYKQKNMQIVDTSIKEVWYIDVVKNINGKIPKWFSNPVSNKKIIGYGQGKTLEEAKTNARNELSYMIKVKVNTKIFTSKTMNNFQNFNEVKKHTKQSSNIDLSSSDYRVYKQDQRDGNWYVGFEYLK